MSNKKTILHIIYNLTRGGAESMLVSTLRELTEYCNVVVTLSPENHFADDLVCDELICINAPTLLSLPTGVLRLRSLVKQFRPALIHSHLPLPNFMARMAVRQSIPLVSTIHTSIANAADYKKSYIRFLDKLTYNWRKSKIIAVSQTALHEYYDILKVKKFNPAVLYTFVDTDKFLPRSDNSITHTELKLVTVGSFKSGKNVAYLMAALQLLKEENITLDIYGRGYEQHSNLFHHSGINVRFRGQQDHLQNVLPKYDALIMPSQFEGFSLSVLEAMAVKLPLLLSDIPSFREQAQANALYFDLNNIDSVCEVLMAFKQNRGENWRRAESAFKLMEENYTLRHHLDGLRKIYKEVLT